MMIKRLLFLTGAWLVVSIALPLYAKDCTQLLGTCDYYACKSESFQCDRSDYLMAFGAKFCQKFEVQEANFSTSGKNFLANARLCLQEEMENDDAILTCKNARTLALAHHIRCYIRHGACDLDKSDKIALLHIIGWQLLIDREFRLTAEVVYDTCPSKTALW